MKKQMPGILKVFTKTFHLDRYFSRHNSKVALSEHTETTNEKKKKKNIMKKKKKL